MRVGVQRHASAALHLGKSIILYIIQKAGWDSRSLWAGTENLGAIGVVTLDRPAHSESLYGLRHSARQKKKLNGFLLN